MSTLYFYESWPGTFLLSLPLPLPLDLARSPSLPPSPLPSLPFLSHSLSISPSPSLSPPSSQGIIVLVLRFGTFLWFAWCLRNTIRLESLPDKRRFYYVFGGSSAFWFLSLPLFTLIAMVISDEYRYRTVTGLYVTMEFIALSALSFLLWPSRASRFFVIKSSPQLLTVNEGEGEEEEEEKGRGIRGAGYGSTAQSAYDDL